MRILIINQHVVDVLGGSEIQCDLIATKLANKGHDIYYYAINGRENKEYNFFPYKIMPATLTKEQLNYYLDRIKPDLVYWRFNKKGISFAFPLIKKKKIRLIFSISNENDVKKWKWRYPKITTNCSFFRRVYYCILCSYKAILERFHYRYLSCADGVVSLSKALVNKIPVKQQVVIYNSMSDKVIDFNWPRPYIVWIANIKANKNPDLFYKISTKIHLKNVDFLMIGKIVDPHFNYLKNKSHKHNFYYLGVKTPEEVNGILRKSMFLVHTCDPEGFGNNFIQAWLQSKPTISLYFDPDNIIKKENLGFVSGNLKNLEHDIKRLVYDKELRKKMGENALKFSKDKFIIKNNIIKYEKFFYKILAQL